MIETMPNGAPNEAQKAADERYIDLIYGLVNKKDAHAVVSKALLLALQLAQEEQLRRARSREPYKSLKTIMAEYLFEDPDQYQDPHGGNDSMLESRALGALLKKAEEAQFDPLTGVYNRRKIQETLDQWLRTNRASERNLEFAVVMFDIDNFKKLNDTFGHKFGDEVLTKIAELLLHTFRRTDLVGRWGGEEFVVLMQASAEDVEEKLNKLWRALQPELQVSQPMQITASIGWTMHTPGNNDTGESLTAAADLAMYQAKNLGKNQVVKFANVTNAHDM